MKKEGDEFLRICSGCGGFIVMRLAAGSAYGGCGACKLSVIIDPDGVVTEIGENV